MTRQRCGSSLLELLVAMPLVALITAVGVHLLITTHQQALATDGALGATRELRHGANVLASEWRALRPTDLIAWSDTSMEFQATVGVGVVCSSQTPRNHIALLGADPAGAATGVTLGQLLQPSWNQALQPGDMAEVWQTPTLPLASTRAVLARVHSSATTHDCRNAANNRRALLPTQTLTLADSLTVPVAVGTPVRLSRRVRYSLYRSSDGDWYLGRKTLTTSGWDVIQPVSGPLLSARDNGLQFQLFDRNNAPLPRGSVSGAQPPVRIHLQLRAPQRAGRAAPLARRTDSLAIDVAFRMDSSGMP